MLHDNPVGEDIVADNVIVIVLNENIFKAIFEIINPMFVLGLEKL